VSNILDALRDAQIEVLRELERVKGKEGLFEQMVALRNMDEGLTNMIKHYKAGDWAEQQRKVVEQSEPVKSEERDSNGEPV
jgi:uncharacterized protein YbaP (TraB family)